MLWPYTIRINRTGAIVLVVVCLIIYFIYSTSLASTKPILFDKQTREELFIDNINLKTLLIASVKAAKSGGEEVVKVRQSNSLTQKLKGKTKEGVDDVLTKGDTRSHWAMIQGLSAAFQGLKIISEEHNLKAEENLDQVIKPIHISQQELMDDEFSELPYEIDVPVKDLTVWIDPLDATKEYTENLTKYVTTMICVASDGRPIIGVIHKPFSKETFWAWVDYGTSANIPKSHSQKSQSDTKLRVIVSMSHAGTVKELVEGAFNDVEVISAAGAGYKTIEVLDGNADVYIHNTAIKKWDICAPNAVLNAVNGKMTTLKGESINYNDIISDNVQVDDGILATLSDKEHDKLLQALVKARRT